MKKARVLPLAAGMLSVAMALTACGSPAKPLSKGGKRFKLTSSYPNNWIGLDIRTRSESTNKITYSQSNEYRGRYAYYLLKEEDKYYLVDFADWSKRMPLPIKDCPVDWMN